MIENKICFGVPQHWSRRWGERVKSKNSSAHRDEAATPEINTNYWEIISQIPVENERVLTEWGWRTLWSPRPSRQISSVKTSPMQHIKPQSRLYLENLFATFSNSATSLSFQDSWRLLKWFFFLLLLRSAVAVMTLTHLIFDSLSLQHTAQSPTETTVQTNSPTSSWLSADSLSGVLMHDGVTLLSYTDVSSGKSHSHLQTISSPQCWSIYGQPRQAQQRTHKAHTPGFKSSWQPSSLDGVDHRATVQIVQYNVLSPTTTWTHFLQPFLSNNQNRKSSSFLMHS